MFNSNFIVKIFVIFSLFILVWCDSDINNELKADINNVNSSSQKLDENKKDNIKLESIKKEDINFLERKVENTLDKTEKEWDLKINFISPKWKITDLTKNITVSFNKPVVSLTSFDNQESCPILIEPKLKGKCVWITTSTFQFRPTEGFPIWAKYKITFSEKADFLNKQKISNISDFEIETPKFELLSINKKLKSYEDIKIIFNDNVNLEYFNNFFELRRVLTQKVSKKITNFDVKYFKTRNSFWKLEDKKNIIIISNKNKAWGYEKEYKLIFKKGLKNIRWNVWLEKEEIKTIKTEKILEDFSELLLKNKNDKELNPNNFFIIKNKKILTLNKPIIWFKFSEIVPEEKDIFEFYSNWKKIDFDFYEVKWYRAFVEKEIKSKIARLTELEKTPEKIKEIKDEMKKVVFIKLSKILEKNSEIKIKIKASKISTSRDLNLSLSTSEKNKIVDFKFKNYKLSCIYFKKDIYFDSYSYYWINNENNFINNFDFNWNGVIDNYSKIYEDNNSFEKEEDCEYKKGLFWYKLNTLLTPEKEITLNIDSKLIDKNIYSLDKNYKFTFKTGKIKNKDKFLSIRNYWNFKIFSKTSKEFPFLITTRNLEKVKIEICNWNINLYNVYDFISNEKNCKNKIIDIENNWFETTTTIIDLKNIFWENFDKQILKVNISKLKKDFYEKKKDDYYYTNNNSHTQLFIINNTNAIIKETKNDELLWLINLENGKSLKSSDINKIETYTKEYDSILRKYFYRKHWNIKFRDFENWFIKLIHSSKSRKSTYLITMNSWEQILTKNPWTTNSSPEKIFIFLDKTIYKPWDTLNIKWFVRNDEAEGLKISKNKSVRITLRDRNWNNIGETKLKINENGGFEHSYKIPIDTKLWKYTIKINDTTYSYNVEKYEKPDFKINLESDKKIYKYSETAKIDIFWEYYLWTGLSKGIWKYTVNTKKYNFSPENFSNYFWWENKNYFYKCFFYWDVVESFKYLLSSKFVLDNFWKNKINLILEWEKNKTYKIDVDLTDPKTKKSVSKSIEFTVLNSEIFAGMKFDKHFYEINNDINIKFLSVDKDWKKIKNTDLEFRVFKKNRKFNEKTFKYESNNKEIFYKNIQTDKNWFWNINYKIKDFWELFFEIKAKNNKFKTTKSFYIYWNDKIKVQENRGKLNIFPKKQEYSVWEKAKINILSNLKWKLLITVEKQNKIFKSEIINFDKNNIDYELEIKKEYLPNFYINATLIWENSTKYESWNIIIKVDKKNIKLNTKVITDKQEYLPWDKQIIELEITDFEWKNIDWEATVAIIDESLLAVKKRWGGSIIDYFYDKKPNFINSNNLLNNFVKKIKKEEIKKINKNENKKYKTWRFYWSSGLNTMSVNYNMVKSESLADSIESEVSASANSTKIRTDFKDIAHYFGTINIVNWKAKMVVDKLPDNLTTWVIDGFVITKNTQVWTINSKFKVKKDLSIIPSLPRFFMLNDEFEIKTVVINNSDKDFEIESNLDISNAEILEKPKKIKIPKNSQSVVNWKVKIKPENNKKIDVSEIKITVKSDKLVDSVILKRNIKSYSSPETVFTNWKTKKISYEEKIFLDKSIDNNFWSLKITMWASILANLKDKIKHIIPKNIWFNWYYLVETVDQISSIENLYKIIWEEDEFKKITIIDENDKILTLNEVVEKFISELEYYISSYYQTEWWMKYSKKCGSYYRSCVDFDLTVKTLKVINKLEKLNYNKLNKIKNNLIKYIKKEINNKIEKNLNKEINDIKTLIILAESGEKEFVLSKLENLEFKDDNLSKLNIIKLYRILEIKNQEITNIIEELKNNVLIEARWSIMPSWKYTDNISTAKALIEFIKNKKTYIENSWESKLIIENFARFIVSNDLWKNSFWKTIIVDALSVYIKNNWELKDLNFEAKWFLDYRNIFTKKFNSENKFKTYTKIFPLKDYIKLWKDNSLGFTKEWKWSLYYDVNLTYFLPIEKIKARDEGLILSRKYYKMKDYMEAYKKECYSWRSYYNSSNNCYFRKIKELEEVKNAKPWEMLVWEIELITPRERNNVVIENFIPAWTTLLNTSLDNTPSIVKDITWWDSGYYWFSSIENYEDKLFMFARKLYSWSYKHTYVIKVNHNWKFHNKPAIWYLLDKPEIWGRTNWYIFEVGE